MVKSIYIHIPFCKNICSYCDFSKMYYNKEMVNNYLDALYKEIKSNYKNEKIETLYIGGGTPSHLNLDELNKLFEYLNIIDKSNLKEYTIECNIEDISIEKLELFKNYGINRLSIGMQTLNKDILKTMGRNIDIDYKERIKLAKKYFDNINVDLIYGFSEDIEILKKDLDFLISENIPHISTYSLILEENTKLYNDNFKRISDDLDYEMYKYIKERLKKSSYIHYEISNFSKNGYQSEHNLTYWDNDFYYGFGLGASSYIDNIRYTNTRSINNYIKGKFILDKEILSKKEVIEYEMILGLRKISGVNKNKFLQKFNCKPEDVFDIIDLINKKLLIDDGDNLFIPDDKLYIENSILVNFVGGSNE